MTTRVGFPTLQAMTRLINKCTVIVVSLVMILGAFSVAAPTYGAIDAESTGLNATAEAGGYGTAPRELPVILGQIINVFIGLLGIIIFLIILYAGIMWMTAAGDETKVKKAQSMIMSAVIGAIVVFSAYAITIFVTQQTLSATGNTTPTTSE